MLFGFCVRDALGVPVEFSTREERKRDLIKEMRAYGTYHQPFGTWSDDTALMICLVDAINRGYSIIEMNDLIQAVSLKGTSKIMV
ncbi:MAG: ADP-ribosylglycohydrolase family protein [Lachnospiraceae bacterium]|nr:ADP-ribosylglycohydrolase family protein [Lachnospiraceae bacterium]